MEEFKEQESSLEAKPNINQLEPVVNEFSTIISAEQYISILSQSLIQIKSHILQDRITGFEQISRLIQITIDFDREFFDIAFTAILEQDEELSSLASQCVKDIIYKSPEKINSLFDLEEILSFLSNILSNPLTKVKRDIFLKILLSSTITKSLINPDLVQMICNRIAETEIPEDRACLLDIVNKINKYSPEMMNEMPKLLEFLEQFFGVGDNHMYIALLYFVNNTVANCNEVNWLDSFANSEFIEKIISSFSPDNIDAGIVILSIIYNIVGGVDGIRSVYSMDRIARLNVIEIFSFLISLDDERYFHMIIATCSHLIATSSIFPAQFLESPICKWIIKKMDTFDVILKQESIILINAMCQKTNQQVFEYMVRKKLLMRLIDMFEITDCVSYMIQIILSLVSYAMASKIEYPEFIEQFLDDDLKEAIEDVKFDEDDEYDEKSRYLAEQLLIIRENFIHS